MKEDFRQALIKTLPILCGYAFLGFAFGILLQKAGFNVFWALLISTVVYAGSLQFLLVSFMAAAAPLLNVFAASLFINSRHLFYGISFIDRFRKAKRYCPYLVFSLTDETYSVLCAEKDLDHISEFNDLVCSFVRMPLERMGEMASEYLRKKKADPYLPVLRRLMPCSMVIRHRPER